MRPSALARVDTLRRCPVTGKPCYDKRAAVSAANKRFREDHVRLRTYVCPHCGAWHLSKARD